MTTHSQAHKNQGSPDEGQAASSGFKNLPGHWILASMGKRVLRPGGRELTGKMLAALAIGTADDVVEFAPGLGATARLTLAKQPASYTAVERDLAAAAKVQKLLTGPAQRCVVGAAESTGLPDACASVLYGEAMLTMQSAAQKAAIAREAYRLLRPGGCYGIHEIALTPDDVSDSIKRDVLKSLSNAIRVGARPQTTREWVHVLEEAGFRVELQQLAPMHLLESRRVIRDEGFWRSLRFLFNVLRTPDARRRILEMRRVFRKYEKHLSAIIIVARKP